MRCVVCMLNSLTRTYKVHSESFYWKHQHVSHRIRLKWSRHPSIISKHFAWHHSESMGKCYWSNCKWWGISDTLCQCQTLHHSCIERWSVLHTSNTTIFLKEFFIFQWKFLLPFSKMSSNEQHLGIIWIKPCLLLYLLFIPL